MIETVEKLSRKPNPAKIHLKTELVRRSLVTLVSGVLQMRLFMLTLTVENEDQRIFSIALEDVCHALTIPVEKLEGEQ